MSVVTLDGPGERVSLRVADVDAPGEAEKEVPGAVDRAAGANFWWLVRSRGGVSGCRDSVAVGVFGLVPAPSLIVNLTIGDDIILDGFPGVIVDLCAFASFPAAEVVAFDYCGVCVLGFDPGKFYSGAADFVIGELTGFVWVVAGEGVEEDDACSSCDNEHDDEEEA